MQLLCVQPSFAAPLCFKHANLLHTLHNTATCTAPSTAPIRFAILMAKSKRARNYSPTIENRIARARYEFLEKHECGVQLLGTEVKSVRLAQVNLRDSYAVIREAQLYIRNLRISPYQFATDKFNHEPLREKKLLLHKREIRKLASKVAEKGLTLVPTRLYFSNGVVKLELALAKGKQQHDRREDIKKRDDQREMRRIEKIVVRGM